MADAKSNIKVVYTLTVDDADVKSKLNAASQQFQKDLTNLVSKQAQSSFGQSTGQNDITQPSFGRASPAQQQWFSKIPEQNAINQAQTFAPKWGTTPEQLIAASHPALHAQMQSKGFNWGSSLTLEMQQKMQDMKANNPAFIENMRKGVATPNFGSATPTQQQWISRMPEGPAVDMAMQMAQKWGTTPEGLLAAAKPQLSQGIFQTLESESFGSSTANQRKWFAGLPPEGIVPKAIDFASRWNMRPEDLLRHTHPNVAKNTNFPPIEKSINDSAQQLVNVTKSEDDKKPENEDKVIGSRRNKPQTEKLEKRNSGNSLRSLKGFVGGLSHIAKGSVTGDISEAVGGVSTGVAGIAGGVAGGLAAIVILKSILSTLDQIRKHLIEYNPVVFGAHQMVTLEGRMANIQEARQWQPVMLAMEQLRESSITSGLKISTMLTPLVKPLAAGIKWSAKTAGEETSGLGVAEEFLGSWMAEGNADVMGLFGQNPKNSFLYNLGMSMAHAGAASGKVNSAKERAFALAWNQAFNKSLKNISQHKPPPAVVGAFHNIPAVNFGGHGGHGGVFHPPVLTPNGANPIGGQNSSDSSSSDRGGDGGGIGNPDTWDWMMSSTGHWKNGYPDTTSYIPLLNNNLIMSLYNSDKYIEAAWSPHFPRKSNPFKYHGINKWLVNNPYGTASISSSNDTIRNLNPGYHEHDKWNKFVGTNKWLHDTNEDYKNKFGNLPLSDFGTTKESGAFDKFIKDNFRHYDVSHPFGLKTLSKYAQTHPGEPLSLHFMETHKKFMKKLDDREGVDSSTQHFRDAQKQIMTHSANIGGETPLEWYNKWQRDHPGEQLDTGTFDAVFGITHKVSDVSTDTGVHKIPGAALAPAPYAMTKYPDISLSIHGQKEVEASLEKVRDRIHEVILDSEQRAAVSSAIIESRMPWA